MARAGSGTVRRTPVVIEDGGTFSGNHPWKIRLVKHGPRDESANFRAAKTTAKKILQEMATAGTTLPYGPPPFEMHHGGSLWVRAADGWRMYRARVGIEWSMQFCADPAKIDRLRREAADLVDAFPFTLPALDAMGYKRAARLLRTPITDAPGVAAWTDSLFNACVPLSKNNHQGILPKAAGEHHYPWPIKGAEFIKVDDFQLWVTLPDGTHAGVVPMKRRGSGDGRVRIVHARHGTPAGDALAEAQGKGEMAVLPADSDIALKAFKEQIPPGAATADGALVTGRARRVATGTRRRNNRLPG
ncbi:DUF6424 family protein [Streptomyces pseudovenezuelae]|uniref:Uncharacterized protein n=1 Tax=Streptomyces pseudovenezuelae TaxID=67350 RepID=A0ABT6M440_9ACTN|nr:DUF6424 family protein [Streptomyces pseudovenezuelae]MDH6222404.1 hypothetical protein [Streptomyces pseudovenezuelae]